MATAIKVDFSELRQSIKLRQEALSDSQIRDRLVRVAQEYSEALGADIHSKVNSIATGNMERALCTVIEPWKTSLGWSVGVGDYNKVGPPDTSPINRHTISEFLKWFGDAVEGGDALATEYYGRHRQRLAAQRQEAEARKKEREAARAKVVRPKPPVSLLEQRIERRRIAEESRARARMEAGKQAEFLGRIRDRYQEFRESRRDAEGSHISTRDAQRLVRTERIQRLSATADSLREQIANLRGQKTVRLAPFTGLLRETFARTFDGQISSLQRQLDSVIETIRQQREID